MITVKNLSLILQGRVILENISFNLAAGEYVGLIGPNGAGKTSLIKTILGFYVPTKGSVTKKHGLKMGVIPQDALWSSIVPLSVEEVLSMAGIKEKRAFQESLEAVGLAPSLLKANFHTLSGGQKQRVIIARALSHNPDILVFDEPLTGVDYATKRKIYALLADLNQKKGLTILFVSHEVDRVVAECQRVLCLNKTMHTGCHPVDFVNGKATPCPSCPPGSSYALSNTQTTEANLLPVHHHHKSS